LTACKAYANPELNKPNIRHPDPSFACTKGFIHQNQKETSMSRKIAALSILVASMGITTAHAQFSDNKIKIGILTDMSSLYSDVSGPGSVEAAKMALDSR
jgi:hypothetical protein